MLKKCLKSVFENYYVQGGLSSVLNLNYLYFDIGNVKCHSESDRYSVKSLKFTKWVAIR